jgi:hypothetical protein
MAKRASLARASSIKPALKGCSEVRDAVLNRLNQALKVASEAALVGKASALKKRGAAPVWRNTKS